MLVLLRFFGEPIHDTKFELNQLTKESSLASAREIGIAQPEETCRASEVLELHRPFC